MQDIAALISRFTWGEKKPKKGFILKEYIKILGAFLVWVFFPPFFSYIFMWDSCLEAELGAPGSAHAVCWASGNQINQHGTDTGLSWANPAWSFQATSSVWGLSFAFHSIARLGCAQDAEPRQDWEGPQRGTCPASH